jgi:hypothetical protein
MIYVHTHKELTSAPSVCYEEEESLSPKAMREFRFIEVFGSAALMAYSESQGLAKELGEDDE